MKKSLKNILLITVMVCGMNSLYANATECMTKSDAERIAEKQLATLMHDTKVSKTWARADVLDVKKKQFEYSTEWLVRFYNTREKDKAKQIMYIFVNLSGEVTGVNYKGK